MGRRGGWWTDRININSICFDQRWRWRTIDSQCSIDIRIVGMWQMWGSSDTLIFGIILKLFRAPRGEAERGNNIILLWWCWPGLCSLRKRRGWSTHCAFVLFDYWQRTCPSSLYLELSSSGRQAGRHDGPSCCGISRWVVEVEDKSLLSLSVGRYRIEIEYRGLGMLKTKERTHSKLTWQDIPIFGV